MRYRLLEPTRQYAKEQLTASGDYGATQQQHTAYYLDLAKPGAEDRHRSEDAVWLERMDPEQDNMRGALKRCIAVDDIESLVLLSVRLTRFWEVRGYLEEGRRWLDDGLARSGEIPLALRMQALGRATYLAAHSGMYERYRALADEWLASARELGDKSAADEATNYQAYYLWYQGDLDGALKLLEESRQFLCSGDNNIHLGAVLMNMGWILAERGELRRARARFEEVIPLAQAGTDPIQEGIALAGLAYLTYVDGDFKAAMRLAQQALAKTWEVHHRSFTGIVLDVVACIAAAQQRADRAARLFGASEAALQAVQSAGHEYPILRKERARHVNAGLSGAAAAHFSSGLAAGRAMSIEEAVAYALADGHGPGDDEHAWLGP